MAFRAYFLLLFLGILGVLPCRSGVAQTRVQLPNQIYPSLGEAQYNAYQVPTPVNGSVPYPSTAPYPGTGGAFDPYAATQGQPIFTPPQNWNLGQNLGNLFNWNGNQTGGAPIYHLGPANTPTYSYPQYPTPQYPTIPQAGVPYPSANPYPASVYPNSTPGVLFPGAYNTQPLNSNWQFNSPFGGSNQGVIGRWWGNFWNNTSSNVNYGSTQAIRLFQGARLRHTWLSGTNGFNSDEPDTIQINDTDVSLVFGFPNFLNSTRMLYIIPSYSHHLWDGPSVPGSDLPSKAFSGFIDTGWDTNPLQTLGMELGVRVGVFSSFDAISTQSIRVMGKGLGRLRLTPNATLKAGVFYLDRNKIKLLPAGGILWTPNPDSRLDIFFPEPKLSHYVSTVGNTDIWWYITGYYGGGTWTMEHIDGADDEIDINDIRVMLGMEFGRSDQIRQGFRLGFFELGYAFDRELIYRHRPLNSIDLHNSFVIRAGLAY